MTLVLTRKPGQKIQVGDGITITIVGFDRYGQVRVGIDAPQELRITRIDEATR